MAKIDLISRENPLNLLICIDGDHIWDTSWMNGPWMHDIRNRGVSEVYKGDQLCVSVRKR